MEIQQMGIGVNEVYSEVIAAALAFPMHNVIKRYAKDHGLPLEVAKEHEVELKKYLVLCTLNPDGGLGMSRVIDELWHTFIFFTRDYHRFCEQVAGRYLHHGPAAEEDLRDGKNIEDYLRTLSEYQLYFGDPPIHLWPMPPTRRSDEAGCSNSTCGNSCSSSTCSTCG